jgi:hypothetical protein
MAPKQLTTTDAVIDFLGGEHLLADLFGLYPQAVAHWRNFEVFPASTYVPLKKLLRRRHRDAPDELWAMKKLVKDPPKVSRPSSATN